MSGENLKLGNDFTINRNAFQGKAIKLGEIKDEALRTYFETQFKAAKENEGKDLNNMFISEKDFEKLYDDLKVGAGNNKLTSKEAAKMGLVADKDDAMATFAAIRLLVAEDNGVKAAGDGKGFVTTTEDGVVQTLNKEGAVINEVKTFEENGTQFTLSTDFENGKPVYEVTTHDFGGKKVKDKEVTYDYEADTRTETNYSGGNKTGTVTYDNKNKTITEQAGHHSGTYEMTADGEKGRVLKEVADRGQGVTKTTEYAYEGDDVIKTITETGQEPYTVTEKKDGTVITEKGNVVTQQHPDGSKTVATVENGTTIIDKFDAEGNLVETNRPQSEPEVEPKSEPPKFSETFEKAGKKVTVDEEGSTQKLTRNTQWETGVVIPKSAQYDGNGVPKEIAIELPTDYGSAGADGKGQRRYQSLKLVDAENNIYADKAGVRQFQMNITEDGITLKQVNVDNDKTKTFLDNNVKVTQENAVQNGQETKGKDVSHGKTIINIETKEGAQALIDAMSDRNLAWGTYTAIGTNKGNNFRAWANSGLMEYLVDKHGFAPEKLAPAVNGLLARVDGEVKYKDNPDLQAAKALLAELNAGKAVDYEALDNHLKALAKEMDIQGTNFMPNEYLRGPAGGVMIEPAKGDKIFFRRDAEFKLPTGDGSQVYTLHGGTRTYDFQDIVGEGGLITNDSTGNNRRGEISFEADKLEAGKNYFFKGADDVKLPVSVEERATGKKDADGNDIMAKVAFIYDENSNKVDVNDILNGRVKMPAKSVAPTMGGGASPATSPTVAATAATTPAPTQPTLNVWKDPEMLEFLDNND